MSVLGLAVRAAASTPPPARPGGPLAAPPVAPAGGDPPPAASQALAGLALYIPSEMIAAYWLAVPAAALLAGRPAVGSGAAAAPATALDWGFYAGLVVLTPVMLLLRFLSLAPRDEAGRLPRTAAWPWWRMTAAAVGFAAWALAVPGNPFLTSPGGLMVAWVGSLLLSTAMGYVEAIVSAPRAGPLRPAGG